MLACKMRGKESKKNGWGLNNDPIISYLVKKKKRVELFLRITEKL